MAPIPNGLAHGTGPGADRGGILESHRGDAGGVVEVKVPDFKDGSGFWGCGEQKEWLLCKVASKFNSTVIN
jgi:hypothetical protein